jgi:hypothetical protein
MSTQPIAGASEEDPRDAAWARPVPRLKVEDVPAGAMNLNVDGREVVGPLQGFGQLWQKTYWVRLEGLKAEPREVMTTWKQNFPKFWPKGNSFYPSLVGIAPGEVALLSLAMPGGMPLSTGMLVLYADDVSFTMMTPQGHMESGWITFSAFEENGATVAQVQSIARANDPMYEIGFMLFAHRTQERFWHDTLTALSAHFGVTGQVQLRKTCVDNRWQWSQAGNVWQNAAVRTGVYLSMAPVRWVGRAVRGQPRA